MSLDEGGRSPYIEAEEFVSGDDFMSITNEKIIGADDGKWNFIEPWRLTNFTADLIMEKHMPTLPDLEVLESGHSDWHITQWRALERKTYSDFWSLGGFKWYAGLDRIGPRLTA